MSTVRDRCAERLGLLGLLRLAPHGLVSMLLFAMLAQALLPAAAALAVAALIGSLDTSYTAAVVTLGLALLADNVLRALIQPLTALVVSQIDGVNRARVARRAALTVTIDPVARPEVQNLIRQAAADPVEWVEKTPGEGAIGQATTIVRYAGLLSSSAVVAAWAWWLVPLLVLSALGVRAMNRAEWIQHFHIWCAGIEHHRRCQYWGALTSSPAEGKEARVFGFGELLVDRHQHHMRAHLSPVWADDRRMIAAKWRELAATVVPLAVVYLIVLWGAADGQGSVALAAAVLAAGWGIFQSITSIGELVSIEGALPAVRALRKLDSVLPEQSPPQPAPDAGGPGLVRESAPTVRFHSVVFRYPGTNRRVLDGLDLEIRPGELLAVVGLNGAGKSTLTKLLAGLHEPSEGRITVDGKDLRDLDVAVWRRHLAIIFQDFVKYELPLADNIALGRARTRTEPAEIEAAAHDVGLTAMVEDRLPDSWATPLSRSRAGGVDLSGGQWQQVALARALYAARLGARVLVMDEPTSHLDVRSEHELFQRLHGLTRDMSTVLITHRLSTVRSADRIVLLDGGRVTESGTHEELVALGGEYARVYGIQAERFRRGYADRLEEGAV
ncbi:MULTISPECIES: ABC transporter ATP-binding protein [unclassified Streptomyces]|uniref:ABC transporter ATP-binding protein n=1 Tax=unclassified Streptomyces TaxID=2593676 RepID=UPI002366C005|nr:MULTISPECIES: ABC transporter ATP-binding protein [unclassified Streptomyces]MDF3139833.1 ABC transporter ATP-binding protein [Streptomyces sp. T21Q-yed]WDF41891.1 ABC transporter ATP-binding protein [Streptomyces sp. T12]